MSVGRLLTRGLGTFGAAHYLLTRGLDSSSPVTVPNVVGETEAQAIIDIQAVGLIESSTTAYSDAVAIGLVISQIPVGGSSAATGSIVSVVISLGPQPVAGSNQGGGGGGNVNGWSSKFEFSKRKLEIDDIAEDAIQEIRAEEKQKNDPVLAKSLAVDLLSKLDDDDQAIAAVVEYESQLIIKFLSRLQ